MLCMTFSLNYPLFHFCQVFVSGKKEDLKFFFTTNDPFFIYSSSRSEPSSLFRVGIIIIMRPFLRELAKVSGVCIRPFV